MLKSDFLRGMEKLKAFYNKKLGEEQMDIYFERLGDIAGEAWPEIVNAIIDCEKFFPPPDTFKIYFQNWLIAHPEKQTRRYEQEEEVCLECDGKGYFDVYYSKGQRVPDRHGVQRLIWYLTWVPCKECENWKKHWPEKGKRRPRRFWTKAEITKKGGWLTDPRLGKDGKPLWAQNIPEQDRLDFSRPAQDLQKLDPIHMVKEMFGPEGPKPPEWEREPGEDDDLEIPF